jgi:hypothetical protein
VDAILGERIVPGWLDHHLARIGYSGQQTDEPRPPRPDNLYDPLPGDAGAHGRFDARARPKSRQVWLAEHKEVVVALSAAVLAGVVWAVGMLA